MILLNGWLNVIPDFRGFEYPSFQNHAKPFAKIHKLPY
jgi:hypothetical protein